MEHLKVTVTSHINKPTPSRYIFHFIIITLSLSLNPKPSFSPLLFLFSLKTSMKTKNQSPKMKQPVPLQVIYPPSHTPKPESSSKEQEGTPISPKIHAGSKRSRGSKKPPTRSVKKMKVTHYLNAEELSKEMSVGFGLDKEWYETANFPHFHKILQTQHWESLMCDYCCNPIYPEIMREFISNFSINDGVCFSSIKEIEIEFDSLTLGEWLGVPATGFDV